MRIVWFLLLASACTEEFCGFSADGDCSGGSSGGGGGGGGFLAGPRIEAPRASNAYEYGEDCWIAPHGTARFRLEYRDATNVGVSATAPIVEFRGLSTEMVIVKAVAAGRTELVVSSSIPPRIMQPIVVSEVVTSVRLEPVFYRTTEARPAFAPFSYVAIAIDALFEGAKHCAIDASLALSHGSRGAWDSIYLDLDPGAYSIAAHADSFGERSFDVDVIAEIDRFEARRVAHHDSLGATVCFHAFAGDREVVVPMHIVDDNINGNVSVSAPADNCRDIHAGQTTVTLTATTAKSVTTELTAEITVRPE